MPGYSDECPTSIGVVTILNILYLWNGFCWCCSSPRFRPTIQRHFDSWFCFKISLSLLSFFAFFLSFFLSLRVAFIYRLCFDLMMIMMQQQSEWTNGWWWWWHTNSNSPTGLWDKLCWLVLLSEHLNVQEGGDRLQWQSSISRSPFSEFLLKVGYSLELSLTRPPYTTADECLWCWFLVIQRIVSNENKYRAYKNLFELKLNLLSVY